MPQIPANVSPKAKPLTQAESDLWPSPVPSDTANDYVDRAGPQNIFQTEKAVYCQFK